MFSMYFHRFPTCYQSIEINIRKTYGVSTTGHQQKFEKAYVVPISFPQVKNHGIAHLPLDDPCLYPPLCDPLPIISILIILIACDWFICHTYLSVGINPYVYHNWKTNLSSYVQTSDQYYHCISYICSIYY